MAYGDKRDYKKIDLFIKIPADKRPACVEYVCSTTWARNLRIAKESLAKAKGLDVSQIYAEYA